MSAVFNEAKRARLEWLESKRAYGDEPECPEDLHPLSKAEWHAGVEAANKEHEEDESTLAIVEDFLVFVVKTVILFLILGAGNLTDSWWIKSACHIMAAVYLWRYWEWRRGVSHGGEQ